jgi:hypothetical protein
MTSSGTSSLRHRPAVRRNAVRHNHRLEGEVSARSARTRRRVRSSRGRPCAGCIQDVQFGIVRKWHLIENRVFSVRHKPSPSCRDYPRQVVIPAILKFDRRRLKPNRPAATPLRSARSFQPAHVLHLRRGRGWLMRISLV